MLTYSHFFSKPIRGLNRKKLILQYKEYPPEEIIEIILNKFYNDNPESRCSIDDLSIIICKM